MPHTFDRAGFEMQLRALVEKFEQDREHYLRPAYSEAQVRLDFVDPFFRALGWDVNNTARRSQS